MIDTNKKQVKPSLTKEEASELKRCETIIEEGLKTYIEVGKALEVIRAAALYRLTHSNFDSYVHDRFKISGRRAYGIINSARIAGAIKGPVNEAQAKALGKVDPDKRQGVLDKAKKTAASRGRKVTARDIHNISGAHKPYTLSDFSKELGGLVNKAKAEGISLLQITDTVGAIHGQLVRMCRQGGGDGNGGGTRKAA